MTTPTLGDLVALLGTAAAVTGRGFDDPLLEVEAAKLAAAAFQARYLPEWVGLMQNRPAEDDDDGALRCRVYVVDKVLGVDLVRTTAGDGSKTSGKASVRTAVLDKETGQLVEESAMATPFLNDPIAKECAGRAKALIGHKALIYRHNEAAPKGYKANGSPVKEFRRIIWIDPADPAGAAAVATRNQPAARTRAEVEPNEPDPPVEPAPQPEPVPSEPAPAEEPARTAPHEPEQFRAPDAGNPFAAALGLVADAADEAPFPAAGPAWDAFVAGWQALRGEGQNAVRRANKTAVQPVRSVHRPTTVRELRTLAELAADVAVPA